MAADWTVDREQQVAVVLVAVVTDVLESAEEARVDSDSGNTVLNVALRKVLVDAETVPMKRSRMSPTGFSNCLQNGLLWKL